MASEQTDGGVIAVASPSFLSLPELVAELEQLGRPLVLHAGRHVMGEAELAAFLRDSGCTAAIIGREPVTDAVLAACPKLRLIAKYGVGLDNLDLEAMKRRGVRLGWKAGVNKRGVTELVIAFMLGHLRNVFACRDRMKRGEWWKNGGRQLSQATVGIVGFGNVGQDLAGVLRAFGSTVLACDVEDRGTEAAALGVRLVGYEELLRESDVVTFHVPLTEGTRGMFGANEIKLCRSTSLIINTARGEVVDFEGICSAVEGGRLGGFSADVFTVEPDDLSRFGGSEAFSFTPHIAGNAREAVLAMGRSALQSLVVSCA